MKSKNIYINNIKRIKINYIINPKKIMIYIYIYILYYVKKNTTFKRKI